MVSPRPERIRRDPVEHDERQDAENRRIGTGLGAAAGAATGAAAGALGGPIGMAAGALLGGLVGGAAGNAVARGIEPEAEHSYWRENYRKRTYADPNEPYERYAPAYQYGWESYSRYTLPRQGRQRAFEELEQQLGRDWESHRGPNDLTWDQARHATRDAWERVHGTLSEARDRTAHPDLRMRKQR